MFEKYLLIDLVCARAALVQMRTVRLAKARLAEAEPDMEEPSDKPVMVCIADIFKVAGTSCCLSVAICDCLDMLDFSAVVLYSIYLDLCLENAFCLLLCGIIF